MKHVHERDETAGRDAVQLTAHCTDRTDFRNAEFLAWEQSLVSRAQAGDEVAWATLYRTYKPLLRDLIVRGRVATDGVADEVVAATFARAFQNVASYADQGRGFWAWLSTIAIHLCIDAGRRAQRERRLHLHDEQALHWLQTIDPGFVRLEREQLRAKVRDVLRRIPPRYQEVIAMRIFDECERQACAVHFGVTVATFDVLFLRAVRAFHRAWTERPSYPEGA